MHGGWPERNKLETALGAGAVTVSVFPPPNLERVTTRALTHWARVSPPTRTLTVAVAGLQVTLGGAVAVPQWASVVVDGVGASYPVQASDTLATVAAALAALLTAKGRTATSAGPVLTLAKAAKLFARVGAVGGLAKEVERSQRMFMLSVWAPSEALRAAAGKLVTGRLVRVPKFLALPDGSSAWLGYERSNDFDDASKIALYQRDIYFWAEFGQLETTEGYEVTVAESGMTPALPPRDPLSPERVSTA